MKDQETKVVNINDELNEEEFVDVEETVEAAEDAAPVVETTWQQDIKNGAAGIKNGVVKAAKKHKYKIIGGAIGTAIVVKKVVESVKAAKATEAIETSETPLLDAPEPEPVEETRDLYILDENTGEFDFIKTCSVEEAEEIKDSLLNPEPEIEVPTDDDVTVDTETTTE